MSLILNLSDINMPGMSGLELLLRAKALRPDVRVIMITAYGDAETKRKALENGAEALLTSPINLECSGDEDRYAGFRNGRHNLKSAAVHESGFVQMLWVGRRGRVLINALHLPSAICCKNRHRPTLRMSLNGLSTDGELAVSSRKRPQKDLGLLYGVAAS